jgi:hypothetical protein
MGYYLRNNPYGKDDLIVHEYFSMVHGNYNPDESGEVQYGYDVELAANWI